MCFPDFVDEDGQEEQIASYTPPRRGGVQVLCHRGVPISKIGITHSQVSIYGGWRSSLGQRSSLGHLQVASIGGVCTHPEYRGLGLATRLLDYCTRKLTAEGARLMLVSGMRGLYTRAGCVTAQDFEYIVLKPDDLETRVSRMNGLRVRLATEADVLLCARLYQAEPVHFVRRVEEFMEHFCQREEFPQIGNALWSGAAFQDMVKRHLITIKAYPHLPLGKGVPYEGIENLRPESEKAREVFASWQPKKK